MVRRISRWSSSPRSAPNPAWWCCGRRMPTRWSRPSWDIFEHQSEAYRDSVLPPDITARVAVEQASTFGWERYVGQSGRVIGMKTFGASAPLKELQRKYGFEPERVTEVVRELLGRGKKK